MFYVSICLELAKVIGIYFALGINTIYYIFKFDPEIKLLCMFSSPTEVILLM